jgi:hypothetical protein
MEKLLGKLVFIVITILLAVLAYGNWFKNWGAKYYDLLNGNVIPPNKALFILGYKFLTTILLILLVLADIIGLIT